MNKVRLSTTPDRAALAALSLGDVVYLDGTVYTAREGVYQRVVESGEALPFDPAAVSIARRPPAPPTSTARRPLTIEAGTAATGSAR